MTNKTSHNLFLTVKELRYRISLSERGIRKLVDRGNIGEDNFDYKKEKSAGRPELVINPMALPEKYKNEYLRSIENEQINETAGTLPDWAEEKATARIAVVRLLKQEKAQFKKEGKTIGMVYDEVAEIYNTGHILEKAFSILGDISGYTVKNWEKLYDDCRATGGNILEAMAPNYGHRKGDSKMNQNEWYKDLILKQLLTPNRLNVTRAAKIVNAELRLHKKEIPCSIKTVQRFVKKWKKNNYDTWVLMREGQKALNDKVMPYIDRDWNLLNVGDVLIADGHVLNFDVKHPVTGKAHRPTMICFLDGRSRYPVGISIMPTENTDNINEALLDAINTLGKFPQAVILDNGRAFKAKHFTKSPDFYDAGIAGIYEKYGILTHFTLPYHGQSKPVEPFFNQFNERFSKQMATYRGASIDTKVPRLMRNEKFHQKLYGDVVGDWLPTISEATDLIKIWAEKAYGQEEHSGLKKGETPLKVLLNGRGEGVKESLLIDLMLKSKAVTPRRARFIIEGIVYSNEDVLTGVNKELLVRYSRNIPQKVWVFDTDSSKGNELICIAEATQAVHPLEKLTEANGEFNMGIRDRLDQRKRLEKRAQKSAKALLEMDGTTHAGHGIPEHLKNIPDATPNLRIEAIESKEIEEEKTDTPTIFEHAYERFEYIAAQKKFADLSEADIDFLRDFKTTGTYSNLYKERYADQVNSIIN
ncbi:MAG: hypothetical protein JJ958_06600 [Balneola sp.]|nr:hypothetical protein [Balneola sp.]